MKLLLGLCSGLISLCIVGAAYAASLRCQIVEIAGVNLDGTMAPGTFQQEHEELIIDLESGKVFHNQFGNEKYANRSIVDYGSNKSSLKIVATSNEEQAGEVLFRNMVVVQVHTYAEGPRKPLTAMTGPLIATGYCE